MFTPDNKPQEAKKVPYFEDATSDKTCGVGLLNQKTILYYQEYWSKGYR